MSAPYDQFLDATIQHLEELQRHGARFVEVTPETMAKLKQPASLVTAGAPAGSAPRLTSPVPERRSPTRQVGGLESGRVGDRRSGTAHRCDAPPMLEVEASHELSPNRSPSPSEPVPATTPFPAPAAPDLSAKAAAMSELRARALVCVKCPNLASSRKNVVFGVGDMHAQLMFVGEAPGADEDTQGEPFVGAAGQLLTKIIQTMGFAREQVYIANILKCRPDTPAGSPGNRKPTPEEMKTCIPYLHSQIDLIQPRVLVALGGVAVEGLLGKSGITKLRGQWQTYRGIPLMPTFHPSYLLRTMSPRDKRHVWEDMLAVLEKLGHTISEKQRGFFLPRSGQ